MVSEKGGAYPPSRLVQICFNVIDLLVVISPLSNPALAAEVSPGHTTFWCEDLLNLPLEHKLRLQKAQEFYITAQPGPGACLMKGFVAPDEGNPSASGSSSSLM